MHNKKKKRLVCLALSVFLPPIAIMLLAAGDMMYSFRNVEALARSYVETFTENIANHIEKVDDSSAYMNLELYESAGGKLRLRSFYGLGGLPALLMLLDENGATIFGSDRLLCLMKREKGHLPVGAATEFFDVNGERFTVAAYPSDSGKFTVVGAISWRDLPASTLRTLYLWPFLMACLALWSGLSVWKIWWHVILPLGELESELSRLKWGEEKPGEPQTKMIRELAQLRATIVKTACDAMDKVSLIRTRMNDLVRVQEEERTKISRDIHDGPLQDVTALLQRIHLAKLPGNSDEEMGKELDLAEKIAQTTVKEMRGLCDFLNPPWLELGLEQALTELTERQSAQYGIRIFLDVDEDLDLSDAVTLTFFRVVQEAVTNSVRHGEAKNIWVDVKRDESIVSLSIRDDGQGFEIPGDGTVSLRAEGHRGLSNMEERMAIVGGRLQIISFPGEGTCIRGLIP